MSPIKKCLWGNVLLFTSLTLFSCSRLVVAENPEVAPPAPFGPLPSKSQLEWHKLEYYGFLHFTVNTFTNKEWGLGDEKPQQFNPTEMDVRQWARVARDAGMKGLILQFHFRLFIVTQPRQHPSRLLLRNQVSES